MDQRFLDECVDEEISMGDFVLTGGEIPAMAVADCLCRMVPGVLAWTRSATPMRATGTACSNIRSYTRPERVWEPRRAGGAAGRRPRQGGEVAQEKQLERTLDKRPDMFEKLELRDKMDKKLAEEIKYERLPEGEKLRFEPRRAEPDVPGVMQIVAQAQRYLRERRGPVAGRIPQGRRSSTGT